MNFTITSVTPAVWTAGVSRTSVDPLVDVTATMPLSPNHTYTGTVVGNTPVIVIVVPPTIAE